MSKKSPPMRIGVLANEESWYLRDLRRAAQADEEIACLSFAELSVAVNDTGVLDVRGGSHALRDFAAVLVRTMPPGSLEQVVFRMDALAQYVEQGGIVINHPKAIEAAVDKFLTSAKLARAGLPTPRTMACQTAAQAMECFESWQRDIVLKPLFGSEGRGITRVSDPALAERAFRMLERYEAVLYLQEFIPHAGYDVRVFVLGEATFAMRRCHATDWRTNVSRGALAEPYQASDEQCDLARHAARVVGAEIAGVDLLPNPSGGWYVLEVNAVPGWQALARVTQRDIAREVLNYARRQAERSGATS